MGNDPTTSVLNANCQAHDVQEPVRRRRRPVRVQRGQELHVDDPGARDAHVEYIADSEARARSERCSQSIAGSMLRLLLSGPRRWRPALVWTPAEAAQAHDRRRDGRPGGHDRRAFKPKFFTAHEYATVRVLVDLIIPQDERSGSATDAGVPEFMDFMMIDQPRRQIAMRGGLALDRSRCRRQRFGQALRRLPPTRSGAACSTTSRAPPNRDPAHRARRRVLQQLPRSHRERVLDDARWASPIFSTMGNRSSPSGTAVPDAALKKLGVKSRSRTADARTRD